MLGHDVTVLVSDDPAAKYEGTLDRLDEKGAVVLPYSYGRPAEPVFIPMHRIKEVRDRGYRPR